MDKRGLTKSILNFFDLVEEHNIKPEQLVLVGGGCGVLSDLWEETDDVDFLPISNEIYKKILKILDEKDIETSLYSMHGYRLVTDFEYLGANYNIFCLKYIGLALREPFFESEKIELNGRTISVRPLKLLYEDYTHGFYNDKHIARAKIMEKYFERAK